MGTAAQVTEKKTSMMIFPDEVLTEVITLEEILATLRRNEPLTPYHHKVLKLEIEAREEAKRQLSRPLFLPDGTLSKAKKFAKRRAELVTLIREIQDLERQEKHAQLLYYFFKKQRREKGVVPPEVSQTYRDTVSKLWACHKAREKAKREADIQENLEKYLQSYNSTHHSN